jgi:dTDP-4-amino-4,6-dideoxy-D-galactose acyltransferase
MVMNRPLFRVVALDWDSNHWSRRVGRVDRCPTGEPGLSLNEICASDHFDFLYLTVPLDGLAVIHAAEDVGFRFMEIRVDLMRTLDEPATAEPLAIDSIGLADSSHLTAAETLAAASHRDTRFARDTHLDPDSVSNLYRMWIRRDFDRDGWALYVATEADGSIDGYITFGTDLCGDVRIGLVGVAESARGRGIGSRLVSSVVHAASELGAKDLKVVTQAANKKALQLYHRHGFESIQEDVSMHWHREALGK